MHAFQRHASHCRHGFGPTNHQNNLRKRIARNLFHAPGLAYHLEVLFFIPNTQHRPADILIQPGVPAKRQPPGRPTAYDVTVRSPLRYGTISKAAAHPAGEAEMGDASKCFTLDRTLRAALCIPARASIPQLDWTFTPLAFDTRI